MKKNGPIAISEMEVQPISDEDLRALTGMSAGAAAYVSEICECTWWSLYEECYDVDQ